MYEKILYRISFIIFNPFGFNSPKLASIKGYLYTRYPAACCGESSLFLGGFSCGNSNNNSAKSIDVGGQLFSYEFDIELTYSSGLSIDRDNLQNIGTEFF